MGTVGIIFLLHVATDIISVIIISPFFLYTANAAEATEVCKANRGKLFASSQSCAKYYDCSGNATSPTKPSECKYPDLFSTQTQGCEQFETVNCTTRAEPQAPCEFYI